jgi:hypothetical protein
MSNLVDCPGGNHSNNNSRISGRGGLPTTCTNCSPVSDGTVHLPTCNREMLWSWEKTTRHPFTGPQLSSQMSTQELMAESVWSQLKPLKGPLNAQLQKFAHCCMSVMSCSLICSGEGAGCSCLEQIFARQIYVILSCFIILLICLILLSLFILIDYRLHYFI